MNQHVAALIKNYERIKLKKRQKQNTLSNQYGTYNYLNNKAQKKKQKNQQQNGDSSNIYIYIKEKTIFMKHILNYHQISWSLNLLQISLLAQILQSQSLHFYPHPHYSL